MSPFVRICPRLSFFAGPSVSFKFRQPSVVVNSANNSLRSVVRVGCGAAIEGDIEGGSRGCRRKQKHTFASTLTQLKNNLQASGIFLLSML